MLRALELNGFKSFADKTRFEFPPGITVVVGPNGSGKSNVVDAIKWVLGEQSVKSLRGKEMADVIFNGAGGRRAVNVAEATLTFDNSENLLGMDTPEVHITRRVYRSGEGEYLINHQACRLRDIRDLFAGTGAATEAYSVIEQGKVDILLQASPKDRRAIFEEAAGISRFKAKKLESLRRLDRVDQNLLRLSDIVDEVESRLRSVKMQAGKARRFKEHTDRLQELRTQVGLVDWRVLTEKLQGLETQLASLREQVGTENEQITAGESQVEAIEESLATAEEAIRQGEMELAGSRERIAGYQSTVDHQRSRTRDLEEERSRHRRHLAAMNTRTGDLQQQLATAESNVLQATSDYEAAQQSLLAGQQQLQEVSRQAEQGRRQSQQQRAEQLELMRASAELGSRISGLASEIAAAEQTIDKRGRLAEGFRATRQETAAELATLQASESQLKTAAKTTTQELKANQTVLAESRRSLATAQQKLAQAQGQHTGAIERSAVLEELERRLEGLSSAVKQLLLRSRQEADGPLRHVRGLVADLLAVNVEAAPLVEVALGEMAHHLVVASGDEFFDYLAHSEERLPGRLAFLQLDFQLPASPADRIQLDGKPGVLGRADRFVETSAEFVPLVRRLLGRTWFVDTLPNALALAQGPARGLRLVTVTGELITAEGTMVVGPAQAATGVISRRSELRALRQTTEQLAGQIDTQTGEVAELESQIAQQDSNTAGLADSSQVAGDAWSEHRLQTSSCSERLSELDRQLTSLDAEVSSAQSRVSQSEQQIKQARSEQAQLEDQVTRLEAELAEAGEAFSTLESTRSELSSEVTSQQVEAAKGEQRLDALRAQTDQLLRDHADRIQAVAEVSDRLDEAHARLEQSEAAILASTAEMAELYLVKERLASEVAEQMQQRNEARVRRTEIAVGLQGSRQSVKQLEEKIHRQDLSAGEQRHSRSTLEDRLREDYGIELGQLEHTDHAETDEEVHEREAVEAEINDLRRKINSIGNVNLEALEELDDLQSRYDALSAQFEDLTNAKASLEQIIQRINADSRRLFGETLETVRGYFQTLFRKLFGGGQADIILDDDTDILESGIEIVARPPGKEPRSISLLSGGEKTMTCVALLLAIFKSRPSPFCVLDEVDAALDEANIGRFVSVIEEFLDWTQFIVVTHSKKTMTCASTLYGVTMQESGISKRVSVRFDDVSEDGHISASALQREEENASADGGEGGGDDETQAA